MSEPEQRRNDAVNINDTQILVTVVKVLMLLVCVYPLIHYTISNRGQVNNSTESTETENGKISINDTTKEDEKPKIMKIKKVHVERQPSCPLSYLKVILDEICKALFMRHKQCTPEDFHDLEKHKIPVRPTAKNNTSGDPRGTIVGCIAAGLLLTSLGAAFVELYKAKSQTPVKTKPPMNRKCSLADLTVLKHNRKELVRRESILEIPENGVSLKQLGFRPPPLYRRCSFPVGPSEINTGSSYGFYTPTESRRTSMEARRLSIIDSRRSSVDCRKNSIDGRRISVDNDSPERRHWSRLVHRH